jgi:hypothetical protein
MAVLILKRTAFFLLLALYLFVWNAQGAKTEWADYYLTPPMPAPLLRIATGYASHMASFGLFVKVSIFSGTSRGQQDKIRIAESLAQNFEVMTELYPDFGDAYIYCQSFLAPLSPEYALRTNNILDRAVDNLPDRLYFPFFQGFNYYFYADRPRKAAEVFFELAKRPGAPTWYGRLAGKLMAQEGNLQVGRNMILGMLNVEQDKRMRELYRSSLRDFDKALEIQSLLAKFRSETGREAKSLNELIPTYLRVLPTFENDFYLKWEPPVLSLKRPGLSRSEGQ